jgi:hypothetical protein
MEVIKIAEAMTGEKLLFLQSDEGGEFRNSELLEEFKKNGIVIKQTVPYHSQTNPVAERSNRTILTMIRTMLLAANLPKQLWSEAAKHAAYTKNRLPHKSLQGKAPMELWKPGINISEERKFLRSFGEKVWIHLPEVKDKLAARALEGQIVGYTSTHGIYRVYCKDKKIRVTKNPKRKIELSDESESLADSKDIEIFGSKNDQSEAKRFIPQPPSTKPEPCTPKIEEAILESDNSTSDELIIDESESNITPEKPKLPKRRKQPEDWSEIVGTRKSTRETRMPERYNASLATPECSDTPTMQEALNGPYKKEFITAIEQEKQQLKNYGVYNILNKLPEGAKIIDTKWVLAIKRDQLGEITKFRFQARKVVTRIQPNSWTTL